MILSDKEIRAKLLESNDPKGWKYSIGEQMRDNLTDGQAAVLAYYYYRDLITKPSDAEALGNYFKEIMGPIIEKTMAWEIERYKDNNPTTIGEE